jgi:hypothetical protein
MLWDLLAIGLLALLSIRGAQRGALAGLLGLATLGLAYGAALLAGSRLGGAAAAAFGVPELVGTVIASTIAGTGALAALGLAARAACRAEARRREREGGRSGGDRVAGAAFGALRAALLLLLVGWLGLWGEALWTARTGAPAEAPESALLRATSATVEAGTTAVLGSEGAGARTVARVAARPAQALSGLQSVVASPAFASLRDDRAFWLRIEADRIDEALGRASFLALAHDDPTRQALAELGLVDERAAADPNAFRVAVREALLAVQPRLARLRDEPALRRLAEDPEVQEMLAAGDPWALLRHQGFQQLVASVASDLE